MLWVGGTNWVDQYYPVCDSDRYALYQTWNSTTSGIMTELAFNIAATEQTEVLNVEVFRLEDEREGYVVSLSKEVRVY